MRQALLFLLLSTLTALVAAQPVPRANQAQQRPGPTPGASPGKVRVQGATEQERLRFHAALDRVLASAAPGGNAHAAASPGLDATTALLALVDTARCAAWIRSRISPDGIVDALRLAGPSGPYMDACLIADAFAKGVRGFDGKVALAALVTGAMADDPCLSAYRERGHVSSEDCPESVRLTLEFARRDGCIARLAQALGNAPVAEAFRMRSMAWRDLLDPETMVFRPRRNGGFVQPFDPDARSFHCGGEDAWRLSLYAPHDPEGLVRAIGGPAALTRRLDQLFTAPAQDGDSTCALGRYVHGDATSSHWPLLYRFSSRPSGLDAMVAKAMRAFHRDTSDTPHCGTATDAWYVLSAWGLHPLSSGDTAYALGIPLFDEAFVDLGEGRTLRILTEAEAGSRDQLVRVTWNGNELERYRTIGHATLMRGGTLRFEAGPRPGSMPVPNVPEADPFLLPDHVPAPIVHADARVFTDALDISITCLDPEATIEYRLNGGPWTPCGGVFTIIESTVVEAVAWRRVPNDASGGRRSSPVVARFVQVDGSRSIELVNEPMPELETGERTLIDGLRGGQDFRTGGWQGFKDQDLVATIDLGRTVRVGRLGIGLFQEAAHGARYPGEVEFALSLNRRQWSGVTATHDTPCDREGPMELWTAPIGKRARYVMVVARQAEPCPGWTPAAANGTSILADEVLIEAE